MDISCCVDMGENCVNYNPGSFVIVEKVMSHCWSNGRSELNNFSLVSSWRWVNCIVRNNRLLCVALEKIVKPRNK